MISSKLFFKITGIKKNFQLVISPGLPLGIFHNQIELNKVGYEKKRLVGGDEFWGKSNSRGHKQELRQTYFSCTGHGILNQTNDSKWNKAYKKTREIKNSLQKD